MSFCGMTARSVSWWYDGTIGPLRANPVQIYLAHVIVQNPAAERNSTYSAKRATPENVVWMGCGKEQIRPKLGNRGGLRWTGSKVHMKFMKLEHIACMYINVYV
jgi:hypothetical protein